MEDIKLEISEKTKREMVEFFMKTSVPRILRKIEEEKKKEAKKYA